MAKIIVGSSLFFKNCRDIDYIDSEKLQEQFKDEYCLFNYMLDNKINPNNPYHYDFFEHVEQNKRMLRYNFDRRIKNVYSKIDETHCTKWIYHLLIQLYWLKNGSQTLTPEQFDICQKAHDYLLPYEWVDKVEKMISEL